MHTLTTLLFAVLLLPSVLVEGWLGVYLASDRTEAVITEVIPGSPAAKAGLQVGDVLLAVGDRSTATAGDFAAAIRAAGVGDRVSIKIRRNSQESIVVARLGDRPVAVAAPQASSAVGKEPAVPPPGEVVAAPGRVAAPSSTSLLLPPAHARGYLGIRVEESAAGLVVAEVLPDSPAKAAGVRVGEVLTSLGDTKVSRLADLDSELGPGKPGERLMLGLRSEGGVRILAVELAPAVGKEGAVRAVQVAPAPPKEPAPTSAAPAAPRSGSDLQQEIDALRQELADLRRQLEELRRRAARGSGGRE